MSRRPEPKTVPPPQGAKDAYSAPTRVGTLPEEVLAAMRQQETDASLAARTRSGTRAATRSSPPPPDLVAAPPPSVDPPWPSAAAPSYAPPGSLVPSPAAAPSYAPPGSLVPSPAAPSSYAPPSSYGGPSSVLPSSLVPPGSFGPGSLGPGSLGPPAFEGAFAPMAPPPELDLAPAWDLSEDVEFPPPPRLARSIVIVACFAVLGGLLAAAILMW
ncbi:MAG: hypothetical protein KF782_09640 [Labilithrix sp.]|nr:hypothetical protein [Labilithrix sp.]